MLYFLSTGFLGIFTLLLVCRSNGYCQFLGFLLHICTVPLKCKLPPSRETHLVSRETRLKSLERVSRECMGSTNT